MLSVVCPPTWPLFMFWLCPGFPIGSATGLGAVNWGKGHLGVGMGVGGGGGGGGHWPYPKTSGPGPVVMAKRWPLVT